MWNHDATEIAYKNGYKDGYDDGFVNGREMKLVRAASSTGGPVKDKYVVFKSLLKAQSDSELDAIVQDLGSIDLREQVKLLVTAYNSLVLAASLANAEGRTG